MQIFAPKVGDYNVGVKVTYRYLLGVVSFQAQHSLEFFLPDAAFQKLVSPYVFGVPVTESSLFFGRTDLIEILLAELRAGGTEKRDLALIGRRRIGKTSVLFKLSDASVSAGFLPVEIDLETVQPKTLRSLQIAILSSALEALRSRVKTPLAKAVLLALRLRQSLARFRLKAQYKGVGVEQAEPTETPWLAKRLKVLLRFLSNHLETLKYIVILIDEATLLLSFTEPHALSYLRGVIQHKDLKRVNFVIAGTDLLHKLTSKEASPLYNLFETKRVGALDEVSAMRLIREPVAEQGVVFSDQAVEEVLQVTSRIPYWIQALCHYLVEILNEDRRLDVQVRDIATALSRLLHHQDLSLLEVWNERSKRERFVLSVLAESRVRVPLSRLEKRVSELEAAIGRMELREMLVRLEALGLVQATDDYLAYSDGILRAWISKNKDSAELAVELSR